MKNALLLLLVIFIFKGLCLGQGSCPLTLEQAPAIRGLRLGMTLDQLYELIPLARNDKRIIEALERTKAEKLPSILSFQLLGYESPNNTLPTFQNIDNFNLQFFDNQLIGIEIQYSWPLWKNADQVIVKLRETFVLPEMNDWEGSEYERTLKCKEFVMSIRSGNSVARISINDPMGMKKMWAMRDSILEKARKEFKP